VRNRSRAIDEIEARLQHTSRDRDYQDGRAQQLDEIRRNLEEELVASRAEHQALVSQIEDHYLFDALQLLANRTALVATMPIPTQSPPARSWTHRLASFSAEVFSRLYPRRAPATPPIRLDLMTPFDSAWYLMRYPELGEEDIDPLEQWATVGWRQGRDPHPLFDTSWYLASNADVARAGVNPLEHYTTLGWRRHVDPHPLFSTSFYVQHNPGVEASGMNPLQHYVEAGWNQGRDPHPLFSTAWYLRTNPDVAAANMNPLVHFALHGLAEGRKPRPARV
jgi:hypothetical protein